MNKKYFYLIAILALAFFLPWDSVFATVTGAECAEISTLNTADGIIGTIFDVLVRIGSWIWIIFAVLAGKLMSNDWVYASGLGLDKALWLLWNYMKNIANFAIAGLLIYQIVRGVIGKDSFNIKALLPKVLVSTVLVNMSWFIMGAAIDLSNIGTAAVGAIPQAFLKTNKINETQMRELLATAKDTIKVQLECKDPIVAENKTNSEKKDYKLDKVWARFNDMSGPLMFMGMSIFRLQEFNITNDTTGSRSDLSLSGIIKIFILVMFLAPIIALLLINLKRVVYLWIIIIFSPLLVLFNDKGLSKMPKLEGKVGGNSINELVSIKEIVGMIFAPMFTIAGMAITLILTSSMFFVLGGATTKENTDPGRVSIPLGNGASITRENKETNSFITPGSSITFQGDIFSDVAKFAGGTVGYLILVTMTILLLRGVLGISANTSKIAASTYDGVMKLGKSLTLGAKFIPMGGMGEKVSLGGLAGSPQALMNNYKSKMQDKQTEEKQTLTRKFGETGLGQFFENNYGLSFGEINDIEDGTVSRLSNSGGDNFSAYLGKLKEEVTKFGKTKITVSSGAKLKKLLTKYASENPSSITSLSKPGYSLTPGEQQALSKFDVKQADKLFSTTEDLGKAFIKVVTAELTGSALRGNITDSSVLFASESQKAKDAPESTDTPETPKASS